MDKARYKRKLLIQYHQDRNVRKSTENPKLFIGGWFPYVLPEAMEEA